MLIQPKWSVLWKGIALLASGDLSQGEPRIRRACVVDVVQPIRATFEIPLRSTNTGHTLQISRIVVFDTDEQARSFLASFTASLPSDITASDCTITDAGGEQHTLSNALLDGDYEAHTESNRFLASFTIRGGALTTAAITNALQTEGGDYLQLEDGSILQLESA